MNKQTYHRLIARAVRLIRVDRRLSQQLCADAIGVNRVTWTHIESYERRIQLDDLAAFLTLARMTRAAFDEFLKHLPEYEGDVKCT